MRSKKKSNNDPCKRTALHHIWAEGMTELHAFVEEHGHPFVPRRYESKTGLSLGLWVSLVRGYEVAERLSEQQLSELQSLSGWSLWQEMDSIAVY